MLFKAREIDDPSRSHPISDPRQKTGSIDGDSINILLQPLVVKDYLEEFDLGAGVPLPCATYVNLFL